MLWLVVFIFPPHAFSGMPCFCFLQHLKMDKNKKILFDMQVLSEQPFSRYFVVGKRAHLLVYI